MKEMFRRGLSWVLSIGLVAASATSFADTNPADTAAARALFDQARKLAAEGKFAEACPKFEESQRLVPGIGTEFNLADCFEQSGRTATAWAMFLDVASQARQAGQKDRETIARQRAAALEAKLSKLSISVASEVPGMEVKRDGSIIGKVMWGTPVPVDPGAHTVEVTAPGRRTWTTTIQVPANARETRVSVPALDSATAAVAPVPVPVPTAAPVATTAPTAPPPEAPKAVAPSPTPANTPAPISPSAPPAPDSAGSGSTQKTVGLVIGGVGLVGAGVATWMTLGAKSKANDADQYCISGTECIDQRGVELRSDAISQANTATIVGGIGALALVGGAVLYFTAPSSGPSTASAKPAPSLAVGPTSVMLRGVW